MDEGFPGFEPDEVGTFGVNLVAGVVSVTDSAGKRSLRAESFDFLAAVSDTSSSDVGRDLLGADLEVDESAASGINFEVALGVEACFCSFCGETIDFEAAKGLGLLAPDLGVNFDESVGAAIGSTGSEEVGF